MDNSQNKKFKIVTLGCRTNQYESQGYADQLSEMGFKKASDEESADVCIVNTCTVTQSADSSSRHAIRQLVRENPNAKIVVTGCFAEGKPEAVNAIDGVDEVISNKDKEQLVNLIFPDQQVPEFSIKNFDAHTRAFVKVQDGCNSYCTYCIIPYVRGRSRSRSIEDIVQEVKALIQTGFKEVVITGINVGDFDGGVPSDEKEPTKRLAELIRTLDKIPGLERLRVSSIDPDEVDEDLLDAILNGKTTCHSMHIVLQSGSNVILKRMNRKYTRQIFLQTIDRLYEKSSDFTITTDIIVGFPGETEDDFEDTLSIMRDVKFAKVHMFPYSDRERTRSALMPNKVPSKVIQERKMKVLEEAERHSFLLREKYVGRIMSVLTESINPSDPTLISGHTTNFLEVILPRDGLQPNQLVDVQLIENTPAGLKGILIS